MSEKKNNRRKGLAVALAVVGVAGLSLASASTLSLNVAGNVQAGTDVLVDCQDAPITVTYNAPVWSAGKFVVTGASLTGIEASCVGMDYTFVALQGAISLASESGDITSPASPTVVAFDTAIDAELVDGAALSIHS